MGSFTDIFIKRPVLSVVVSLLILLIGFRAAMVLPITGDRGFTHAEATAGGVPLTELRLETMESRVTPGLYVCGEVCDVDGRIGGYNFQWAWSSGWVAGTSAVIR